MAAETLATVKASSEAASTFPRTWVLLGPKVGDNAQLLALAEALGWPFETRRLAFRGSELVTNVLLGPNLLGLKREGSDVLTPPWPDLVLTAGRRNEPVARWIKKQAGGRTRLIHVGRPWARLEHFDLIITTPQYFLPERPNVLHLEAPLHRMTAARLEAGRHEWAPRLAHLPSPRVAAFLGGHSGPYSFDREAGALMGAYVERLAAERGGSILATTSARTPAAAADAFEAQLKRPHEVYRFAPGRSDNPYVGFLALADLIVVTGDSMSMLVEAIASGRPVLVFDLARGRGSRRPSLPVDGSVARLTWRERLAGLRLPPLWFALGQTLGPRQLRRDVGAIHRRQIEAGRAAWLGEAPPKFAPVTAIPPPNDLDRAAAAVRDLVSRRAAPPAPR